MTRRSATAEPLRGLPATLRVNGSPGAAPQTPLVGALRLRCEVGAARLQGAMAVVFFWKIIRHCVPPYKLKKIIVLMTHLSAMAEPLRGLPDTPWLNAPGPP